MIKPLYNSNITIKINNWQKLINFAVIACCLLNISCGFNKKSELQERVEQIVKHKNLTVGVAVHNENGDMLVSINSDKLFPMQSVYKLPIAMAYLSNSGVDCLTDSITISKNELLPNTWSPFREAHPNGATIAAKEFIECVVAKSDNNLCDIMIDLAGGIDSVENHIKGVGVNNIAIKNYEREIQSSWEVQFNNYATPNAVIELLGYLWEDRQKGSKSTELLWQIMRNTKTGSARELLPTTTNIGYKTGFSGKSSGGITAANNCVGIIDNNDKEDIFFAIFITNSNEEEKVNYEVISEIIKEIEGC